MLLRCAEHGHYMIDIQKVARLVNAINNGEFKYMDSPEDVIILFDDTPIFHNGRHRIVACAISKDIEVCIANGGEFKAFMNPMKRHGKNYYFGKL